MKIVIYSHDLIPENVKLMPWRTLLEIAKKFQKKGHNVIIFSGRLNTNGLEWEYQNILIREVVKPKSKHKITVLTEEMSKENPDILYWPFSWWGSSQTALFLKELDVKIIGYIPGAKYSFKTIIQLFQVLEFRLLLPYLAQSLFSNKRMVKNLNNCCVDSIVTMTEFNRQGINKRWLGGKKSYLLFTRKIKTQVSVSSKLFR